MKRPTSSSSSQSNAPAVSSFIERAKNGVYIRVRVTPRASKNAIEGVVNNALKVRLCSPPVEGEANRALIELLAKILGIKKSAFTIVSGETSRDKRVFIEGAGDEVERVLGG